MDTFYQILIKENKELKLKLNIINDISSLKNDFTTDDVIAKLLHQQQEIAEKIKHDEIAKLKLQKEKNNDEIEKKHRLILKKIEQMKVEVELAEQQLKNDIVTEKDETNKEINLKLEKLSINQERTPAKPKTDRAPTYKVNNEARYLKEKHKIIEIYYTSNKSNYKLTNRGTYWVDEDGEVHTNMNSHSKKRIKQRSSEGTTKENAWLVHRYFGKNKRGEKLEIYKPTAEDEGKW
jgi:hypothetical protein